MSKHTIMPTEIVRRLDRFIGGESRTDDLDRIFQFLRGVVEPKSFVKDVGDLVAHRHEKSQGIIVEFARDSFWGLYLVTRSQLADRKGDLSDVPARLFRRSALATVGMYASEARKRFGLKAAEARKAVERVCDALEKDRSNYASQVSASDLQAFDKITRSALVYPKYSGDQLFREFSYYLTTSGGLDAASRTKLKSRKDALTAWAVALMHNCKVDLGEGFSGKLVAHPFDGKDVGVFIFASVVPEKNVGLGLPIFQTALTAEGLGLRAVVNNTEDQWADLELTDAGGLREL